MPEKCVLKLYIHSQTSTAAPLTFGMEVMGMESTRVSKVHGANMGPIWGRQDPGGPHVGPMNFAIWDSIPHFF